MKYKIPIAIICVCLLQWFPANASSQLATTTTEHLNFAPGGVVRVLDSFGSLTVEGWDRSEVEITVTQPSSSSDNLRVIPDRRSDTELTISTVLPRRQFTRWLGNKGGILRGTGAALDKVTGTVKHPLGGQSPSQLEYHIYIPRESRLVIRHGNGYVLVTNIAGDVEARSTGGDVVLVLPQTGAYSIDARSKFGTVASDFEGSPHRRLLVSSGLVREAPSPARRIYVRTRVGGITIKAVPVEGQDPVR